MIEVDTAGLAPPTSQKTVRSVGLTAGFIISFLHKCHRGETCGNETENPPDGDVDCRRSPVPLQFLLQSTARAD